MAFKVEFHVANPSPYQRTDYVEVDLTQLAVPAFLDETSLTLWRVHDDNTGIEIPFQIDRLLGDSSPRRVLCFLSENTPPGPDDYSRSSATFRLEERVPQTFDPSSYSSSLRIDHYYKIPKKGEPADGYNSLWYPHRDLYNLKFDNGNLEFAFCLVPHPRFSTQADYTGSATSVSLRAAPNKGDMLCPYGANEDKRWGQLTQLVFFSIPWELTWFHAVPLLGTEYTVVWSKSGPMRAIASIRSEPIHLSFQGSPYIDHNIEITCHLYRVLYVYPHRPFYTEELFVLSDQGVPLGFRAYYASRVWFPSIVNRRIARFEHIPDYFAVWREWSDQHHGYGFAADSHVRGFEINGDALEWRLQLTFRKKCIHYFMFSYSPADFDPFNEIGHSGWYERAYKPLEPIPLDKAYYPLHGD